MSLLSLYIYQKGLTDFDAESTEALPLAYVLIFSVLFILTLYYFRAYLVKKGKDEELDHSI